MRVGSRTKLLKQGRNFYGVLSPADSGVEKQVKTFVEDNGSLKYSVDGSEFKEASSGSLKYKTFDVNETYKQFEVVNYYDRIIISKIDNNVGNYPTLQPSDPNWLFLSFFSEQLPIKAVSNQLYILGSSTPSTSGNEAIYKEGNCYILDGKVYDKDGVLANNIDLTNEISAREQADTNLQTQINDKASLTSENTFNELQIFNDYIILKDGYGIKSRLSTGALKNIIFKDGSGSSIIIGDTSLDIITNGKSFLPMTNIDLGSTALKWRNVYVAGNLSDGTNSVAVADIAKKSSFVLNGTTLNITME